MRNNFSLAKLIILSLVIGFQIFISPSANAGCGDYPESTTPACAAQNMAEQQAREAARIAQMQADAEAVAKANAEKDYIANGSRPCSLYPASITPACAAENLADATAKQAAQVQKQAEDQVKVEEAAKANAEKDYIANGSRPCSLYPASITPACAAENLRYEEAKKIEVSALTSARTISSKSLIVANADNGSLVISAIIPKNVNLLKTTVKLLNNKGKVVDTGIIRYESSGKPYFVFNNFNANGNYKIQLSIPKKNAVIISVKL